MSDPPPSTLISGGRLLSGGRDCGLADVRLESGRIAAVGDTGAAADVRIDARGLYVIPGLIDVHVHGAGGHDVAGGAVALAGVARALAARGTTAFLATSASMAIATTERFVETVAAWAPKPTGAELLGSHLEGPWINPAHRGAHDASLLRTAGAGEGGGAAAAWPGNGAAGDAGTGAGWRRRGDGASR